MGKGRRPGSGWKRAAPGVRPDAVDAGATMAPDANGPERKPRRASRNEYPLGPETAAVQRDARHEPGVVAHRGSQQLDVGAHRCCVARRGRGREKRCGEDNGGASVSATSLPQTLSRLRIACPAWPPAADLTLERSDGAARCRPVEHEPADVCADVDDERRGPRPPRRRPRKLQGARRHGGAQCVQELLHFLLNGGTGVEESVQDMESVR